MVPDIVAEKRKVLLFLGNSAMISSKPSFKMVTNNLGYEDSKAEKLKKFNGNNNDQFAFPEIRKSLDLNSFDQKYVERLIGSSTKTNLDWKLISMKTLEGGKSAFGERGKIYGNT